MINSVRDSLVDSRDSSMLVQLHKDWRFERVPQLAHAKIHHWMEKRATSLKLYATEWPRCIPSELLRGYPMAFAWKQLKLENGFEAGPLQRALQRTESMTSAKLILFARYHGAAAQCRQEVICTGIWRDLIMQEEMANYMTAYLELRARDGREFMRPPRDEKEFYGLEHL